MKPWTSSAFSLEQNPRMRETCQRLGVEVVLRARAQELWYWPGSEVRRLEVALRSQGAEMGVFLRVRGRWVERLFSRVRVQDLGAALSLHHYAGPQAL